MEIITITIIVATSAIAGGLVGYGYFGYFKDNSSRETYQKALNKKNDRIENLNELLEFTKKQNRKQDNNLDKMTGKIYNLEQENQELQDRLFKQNNKVFDQGLDIMKKNETIAYLIKDNKDLNNAVNLADTLLKQAEVVNIKETKSTNTEDVVNIKETKYTNTDVITKVDQSTNTDNVYVHKIILPPYVPPSEYKNISPEHPVYKPIYVPDYGCLNIRTHYGKDPNDHTDPLKFSSLKDLSNKNQARIVPDKIDQLGFSVYLEELVAFSLQYPVLAITIVPVVWVLKRYLLHLQKASVEEESKKKNK